MILYDRIKEISRTTGSGNMTLLGAVPGFRGFGEVYSSGDLFFYGMTDGTYSEVGSGVYRVATIERHPISGFALVDWTQGVKEIFVTNPALYSFYGISIQTSGAIPYLASENLIESSPALTWDGTKISVVGSISGTDTVAGAFGIYESGIYYGNDPVKQFQPYLRNTLDANTGIDDVIILNGDADQIFQFNSQPAGHVLIGPVPDCGSPPCPSGYPTFRALQSVDIPSIPASLVDYTPDNTIAWNVIPTQIQEAMDILSEDLFFWTSDALDNSYLIGLVNTKKDYFDENTAFNKNFGTASGEVPSGNDVRFASGLAAYGWGDHGTEGYLVNISGQSIKDLSDVSGTMSPTNGQVLRYNSVNGWYADTINSSGISAVVEDTSPQLNGTLDANGNIIDMGTNNITDAKVGLWDTAYGWGDHAGLYSLTSHDHDADYAELNHTQAWSTINATPTTIGVGGYGISDTKSNFNTVLNNGNFVFENDNINLLTGVWPWANISSTPTTLADYGITGTKANFNAALTDGTFLFASEPLTILYPVWVGSGNTTTSNDNGKSAVVVGFLNDVADASIGINNTVIGMYNDVNGAYNSVLGDSNNLSSIGVNANTGVLVLGRSNTVTGGTDNAIAAGRLNALGGDYSVALGHSNETLLSKTISIGYDNSSFGPENIAIGNSNSNAAGTRNVSIGTSLTTNGVSATNIGYMNIAANAGTVVIGRENDGSGGFNSVILGRDNTNRASTNGIIIGESNSITANAAYGMTLGWNNTVSANLGVVIGNSCSIYGTGCVNIGLSNTSLANRTSNYLFGKGNSSDSNGGLAVGRGNTVPYFSTNSCAIGFESTASGLHAISLGNSCMASGQSSIAIGNLATTGDDYAIAIGDEAKALGVSSISIGDNSYTNGSYNLSVGFGANCDGLQSVAVGFDVINSGDRSSVFGNRVKNTRDDIVEIGKWSSGGAREGAVRISNNGVGISYYASMAGEPTDGGANAGQEAAGTLARGMYMIRADGDDVYIDINIGGNVKSILLGTAI